MTNHWRRIVANQLDLILNFKLYDKTEKIFVACLGSLTDKTELRAMLPDKFDIVFHNTDMELCEIPILQYMQDMAKNDNFIAWYIHTKGVFSEKTNTVVSHWRAMMEYFVIERNEECINEILHNHCDACGIDVRYLRVAHQDHFKGRYWCFIGNFWWSKSTHVNSLPNLTNVWLNNKKSRYTAEVFIGLGNWPRLCSFYNKKRTDQLPLDMNYKDNLYIDYPARRLKFI